MWNNLIIPGNEHKNLSCPTLMMAGVHQLNQVLKNKKLLTPRQLARICQLHPTSAGRISKTLEKNIEPALIDVTKKKPRRTL